MFIRRLNKINQKYQLYFIKSFFPLFILAAILPVILIISYNKYVSKKSNTVRIWLDPPYIKTIVNKPITLRVIAEFEDTTRYLPSINVVFNSDQFLKLNQSDIKYFLPFRGSTVIGQIDAQPMQKGIYTVFPTDISIPLSDTFDIKSTPATIIVN